MRTINKIQLLGYVGRDPEMNATTQGLEVAGISIATSNVKKNGDKVTQWHNCVAFGKTAELVAQYAKKGSRIYVEGEMQYSEYEKDGVKMFSAKVVINAVSFIDFESDTPKSAPAQQRRQEKPPIDESDIPF